MEAKEEIRLRIVEAVLPAATKVGLNEPEHIVKTCSNLENYVLGLGKQGEKQPVSSPRREKKRPRT